MKWKLKIILLVLIAAMLLPFNLTAYSEMQTDTSNGVTYLNLPTNGYGGPQTKSTLHIQELTVQSPKLTLNGSIESDGRNFPIKIQGTIHKSLIETDTRVVILPEVIEGDFEIVHMSFDTRAIAGFLLDQALADQKVFSLYVMKKDTREASFFNLPFNTLGSEFSSSMEQEIVKAVDRAVTRGQWEKRPYDLNNDPNGKEKEQYELEHIELMDNYYHTLFAPIGSNMQLASTLNANAWGWKDHCFVAECKDPKHFYVVVLMGDPYKGCFENQVIKWSLETQNFGPGTTIRGRIKIEDQYTKYLPSCGLKDKSRTDLTLKSISAGFIFNGSNSSEYPWGDVIASVKSWGNVTYDGSLIGEIWRELSDISTLISAAFSGPSWSGAGLEFSKSILKGTANYTKYTLKGLSQSETEQEQHFDTTTKNNINYGPKQVEMSLQKGRMGTNGQIWYTQITRPNNIHPGTIVYYYVKFTPYLLNAPTSVPGGSNVALEKVVLRTGCGNYASAPYVCSDANSNSSIDKLLPR